jgi:hypothetical protein
MQNREGLKGFDRNFVITLNACIWLILCVGLFRHWRTMSVLAHASGISLATIFPTLCLFLLREENGFPCLLIAGAAFAAAVGGLFA